MGTEENYLDNLLKSVTELELEEAEEPAAVEELIAEEAEPAVIEEPIAVEELTSEETEAAEMPMELELSDMAEELKISDIMEEPEPDVSEMLKMPEELDISDAAEISDILGASEELDISDAAEISDILGASEELDISDAAEEPEIPEALEEAPVLEDLQNAEALETADIAEEIEIPDVTEEIGLPNIAEELKIPDAAEEAELPDIADVLNIADISVPDAADNLLEEAEAAAQEDSGTAMDIPEIPDIEPEVQSTDGLEELPQSETELGMSDELNLEELDLDVENIDSDLEMLSSRDNAKSDSGKGVDDGLDDVLSMLDDDADLAEINDILKKSDSNEPIQDEMMDLLSQMADDEAALVNAGVKNIEEDGGVPIPDMPPETKQSDEVSEEKAPKKKKKGEDGENAEKKPGAIGKLFNLLTEELPGPTEADYAVEDEKKAAKKAEAQTKKEQDKLAKDEAKQAKAEEKEAAKKAKAEAAAQKKKEKQEAKEKKEAEKKAKQAAEAIKKAKRIPPKKIAAVAVFGASVFGGVLVATNVLSNQGYVNVARQAFYDGDYKSVYLATYGMKLGDSDEIIKAKSEVILKLQRWYDAYQNNLKLGREREALDSLIRGIESYDYINAEAEACDALNEIESIKGTILGVLQSRYGLDEEQARALLNYESALDYTIALNNVITGQ